MAVFVFLVFVLALTGRSCKFPLGFLTSSSFRGFFSWYFPLWVFINPRFFPLSDANYCLCRDGATQQALQKALDYACGAGADCSPILSNGACFQPNTVKDHCNYAVNSYFQRKGQVQGSCDFNGAATPSVTLTACKPDPRNFPFPLFSPFFLILSFADFIFFLVGLWQLCPLVVSILLAPGTFSKFDSSVAFRLN